MKKCTKCGTQKPASEFNRHGNGRRPDCRDCQRKRTREAARRVRANPATMTWDRRMAAEFPGIFRSLAAHKTLCTNPNIPQFHNYGGRGIRYTLPTGMREACELVLATLGPRPEGHTLDRIDVDGDFALDNLKWATPKEQANNRRVRPTAGEWAAIGAEIPAAQELLLKLRA